MVKWSLAEVSGSGPEPRGWMTSHAQLDQSGHSTGQLPGVSGAVVHVLIDLVRRRAGEIGVAQALALADDHRTFSDLDDFERWSSFEEGVRLFNAAALVTGDEAVGLHVGERLLSTADGSDFVERLPRQVHPKQCSPKSVPCSPTSRARHKLLLSRSRAITH